ncbi:hypothetical protein B0O99DRAFT_175409 [Bisporella sp. PMI_857]|jgi:hypothetical protein|nr:hypothetical protein B0O99DRAFT_175409 [Bisporella sp. PMI_857]
MTSVQVDRNGRQYLLITNVPIRKTSSADAEIDLYAASWNLPYNIDDADLTFDGKPLNLLYEENRYMAEHTSGNDAHHVSI